jgi:hypothetical protein
MPDMTAPASQLPSAPQAERDSLLMTAALSRMVRLLRRSLAATSADGQPGQSAVQPSVLALILAGVSALPGTVGDLVPPGNAAAGSKGGVSGSQRQSSSRHGDQRDRGSSQREAEVREGPGTGRASARGAAALALLPPVLNQLAGSIKVRAVCIV